MSRHFERLTVEGSNVGVQGENPLRKWMEGCGNEIWTCSWMRGNDEVGKELTQNRAGRILIYVIQKGKQV